MSSAAKILIVEDELIIGMSLQDMLNSRGYDVVDLVTSAAEAIAAIGVHDPDLILVDIQIHGEHDGTWLGSFINKNIKLPFVYLTSFTDSATVAKIIESSPFGYLTKPVDPEVLYATIQVALGRAEKENQLEIEGDLSKKSFIVIKDALLIKDDYRHIKIPLEELLYVRASGNYIDVLTKSRKYVLKQTLKEIMSHLPEKMFFQTHRSFLVNLAQIETVGANTVTIGHEEIPLSKQNRENIFRAMQSL